VAGRTDRTHGEVQDILRKFCNANLFIGTMIFVVGLVVTIDLALGYYGMHGHLVIRQH
jgi:hypothetical protein